jgi:hypothetical protein
MTPRRAALIGVLFPIISVFYVSVQYAADWPIDWAGATMLVALGAAMSIMSYVLVAGISRS